MGDWENPYRTMDWSYERRQLEVVRDMVRKGECTFSYLSSDEDLADQMNEDRFDRFA